MPAELLDFLSKKYGTKVGAEDLVSYVACVTANPSFTARFLNDLSTPGLRIPLTAERTSFEKAMEIGRMVIWLHTFGERMTDPEKGRPAKPPRLPAGQAPQIPAAGAISEDPSAMPDTIEYDAAKQRLLIGQGYIENVDPRVWNYEVSGKRVLVHWFSYRKKNRDRPIIGDRRPPSPLGEIQPEYWLAEYTTELINLLNVLGLLVELEPLQATLLEKICTGPLISEDELRAAGAIGGSAKAKAKSSPNAGPGLFDSAD